MSSTGSDTAVPGSAGAVSDRRPGEGLRERKKRLMRELISDTATEMFLDRGFEAVTVAEIADACDISEKTVFNYFPTKESLLFDEEDELTERTVLALRNLDDDGGIAASVTEAVLGLLEQSYSEWTTDRDPAASIDVLRRFSELVESHPGLVAALQAMLERLTEAAAEALAERAGVDPEDPEPRMAALIVVGLWRAYFGSMRRTVAAGVDAEELREAVIRDVRRAARVADSGLSAFNLVVRSQTTKQQVRDATEAANDARRQVVEAVRQARDVWRQVVDEAQSHVDASTRDETPARMTKAQERAYKLEMKREIRQRAREMQRQMQRQLRQQQREMEKELRGNRTRRSR